MAQAKWSKNFVNLNLIVFNMKSVTIKRLKEIYSVILFTSILFNGRVFAQPQMQIQVQKLDAVLQMINYAYVDTVNEKKLTEDAIRTILKDLDPHSAYIPVEDLKDANEPLVGNFEGVGIQFNILEDTIFVTNTIPGGPSEKVGVHAGDRILKIDNENVAGIKIKNSDVLKKLRGTKGTKVTVSITRRDEINPLEFVITRDKIPLFSVDAAYMAAPEIGYIKISRFADTTVDEFKEALNKLKQQGIKNLILDLSDNGGGYLNRAIELADEFLGDKKRVVFTEGVHSQKQESFATAAGGWEKGKLVVMVDEYSASASEIVTGALQDWDRALVVGRRSFGKGLVQKPFSLPDGSVIRLTIARYYTPSGRCIQKAYDKGDDEYDMDIYNRNKNGELYSADSIHIIDSLKYFTNAKRVVYGGGGIIPDIFVPRDTSMFSNYYRDLQRKGILNDYTLSYVDKNRNKLNAQFPDINKFINNFNTDENFMIGFFKFADKKEVKKDEEGWKISEALIKTQLKALAARDLFNTEAYFHVINNLNNSYNKAVECIQNNTFDKIKIAEN